MRLARINRQQDQRCTFFLSSSKGLLALVSPSSLGRLRHLCDIQVRPSGSSVGRSAAPLSPRSGLVDHAGPPTFLTPAAPALSETVDGECGEQTAPHEPSDDDSSDVWSCQLVRVYLSTTAASWVPRPPAPTLHTTHYLPPPPHPPHYQIILPRRGAAADAFVHGRRGRALPPTAPPPPPSRNPVRLHGDRQQSL